MRTKDVLVKAREIAERTWVPVDGDGYGVGYGDVIAGEVETCCGAVVAALDPDAICLAPAHEEEDAEAFSLLVDCAGVGGLRSLEQWNDTVGRTKDEVLGHNDYSYSEVSRG